MGYYTNYSLSYKGMDNEELNKKIAFRLVQFVQFQWADREMEDCENYGYLIDDMISSDSMKWYYHDDDMLALSLDFPEITFILDGHGEGEGLELDIWRSYYRNGKMQECSAILKYEPHDSYFDN